MTPTAGIGFKAQHFEDAMASPAAGLWFEVHAENYMVAGGPRLAMLEAIRAERPLSLHGVGMSLASPSLPDPAHAMELKRLVDRFDPFLVSEHLAWSRFGTHCMPDLLPFPRCREALQHICRNIDRLQSLLGRSILVENPSHYLEVAGHEWSEQDFLAEIARSTGCGLLLDLNNVQVSARNLDFKPADYLAGFPIAAVEEIHLAGAMEDAKLNLLIDNHGAPVAEPVWKLLNAFVERHGPRPVLIERDREVPEFAVLMRERDKAAAHIAVREEERADA
jgi:hypothetical protein